MRSTKATYAIEIGPLLDKNKWMKVDIGYKVLPPKLNRRPLRRPKKRRIRGIDKNISKRMHKCKHCDELGHDAKTCKILIANESKDSASSSSTMKKCGR